MGYAEQAGPVTAKPKANVTAGQILGKPIFYVCALMGVISGFVSGFYSHVSAMAVAAGLTIAASGTVGALVSVGSLAAKPIAGVLSDKLGPARTLMVLSVVGAGGFGLCLAASLTGTPGLVFLGALMFGMFFSAQMVSLPLLTRSYFDSAEYVKAHSYVTMAMSILSALTTTIYGVLLDVGGNYNVALLVLIATMVLGLVVLAVNDLRRKAVPQP